MPRIPFVTSAQEKAVAQALAQAEAQAETIRALAQADAKALRANVEREAQEAIAKTDALMSEARALLLKAERATSEATLNAIPTASVAAVGQETFFYRILTKTVDESNNHPYLVVAFWRSREDALLGKPAAHINDFRFGPMVWSGVERETGIRFSALDTLKKVIEGYWSRVRAEEERTGKTIHTGTLSRVSVTSVDSTGELALLADIPSDNEAVRK